MLGNLWSRKNTILNDKNFRKKYLQQIWDGDMKNRIFHKKKWQQEKDLQDFFKKNKPNDDNF
jgi:hypothetical protein